MKAVYTILLGLLIGIVMPLKSQSFKTDEEKAEYYMGKSLKVFENKKRLSVKFETIAYGLKQPKDIFLGAVYEKHQGGYIYLEGEKYEYSLGMVKIVCDSKILVYIDEMGKQMMIDSVREQGDDTEQQQLIEEAFYKRHGDFTYQYLKVDTLKGKTYHKIKCTSTKEAKEHIYYWISTVTEQMYMYAESGQGLYNVFVIGKIGTPPRDYKYKIHLPDKELTTLYGYEVFDHRFVYNPAYKKDYDKLRKIGK